MGLALSKINVKGRGYLPFSLNCDCEFASSLKAKLIYNYKEKGISVQLKFDLAFWICAINFGYAC